MFAPCVSCFLFVWYSLYSGLMLNTIVYHTLLNALVANNLFACFKIFLKFLVTPL